MFARSLAVFSIFVLFAHKTGYNYVKGEETEVAEEIMAPKEEYLNVLENLPLLYTHVVDVLQEKPQVLERNDVRMKREIDDVDEDNMRVKFTVVSNEMQYYTEILQYEVEVINNLSNNEPYDVQRDTIDGDKTIRNYSGLEEGKINNKFNRTYAHENVSSDKKMDQRHKENIDGSTNLERARRSIERVKLTREDVEKLYELVEAEIEKASG